MNNKITYFILALICLIVTIKGSTARSIPPLSDVSPLLQRRHEDDVCYDYIAAEAKFCGQVTGIMTFIQDDSADITFVNGLFSKGLDYPEKHQYNIVLKDCDGKIVKNLTKELCLKFVDGGTEPFSAYVEFDLFEFLSSYDNGMRKRQDGDVPNVGVYDGTTPVVSVNLDSVMPQD
ncbi:hypothetical protein C2G38_2044553 [Gigaspora rosea]|uniref:Uncharacterized protein n=1 Tax=Gigaspora rosea TaxID=44941 RepID=A0A397UG45_9GLOM|nr:hypothetical protein C2G38_2044553 [Gigaspora rosea]